MRKLITLIIGALIITGSYFIAFGAPTSIGPALGIQTKSHDPAGSSTRGDQSARANNGSKMSSSTAVVLTPLEMRPYEDILRAIGSARALHRADVVANASGEVLEVNLPPNQQVSAGDVLVKLDARIEIFNLDIAQTELDQAREIVGRYERLQATGNSTVTVVAISEARVAERLAKAKVGLAQTALDKRTIKAPISGKLGLSDVQIGNILNTDSIVVTIDNSEALLVEFALPERSIGLLAKAQTVLASTPTFAGQVFEGKIVSFDSRLDSVTRSVMVKARIENSDALLWPGMTFSVRIIHENDPLAVIPSTAITWSRSGSSVWIENNGIAEQVPATILFRRNDQVWIKADIPVGTLVVTEGAHKLRSGSRIAATNKATQYPDPKELDAGLTRVTPGTGQVELRQQILIEEPT